MGRENSAAKGNKYRPTVGDHHVSLTPRSEDARSFYQQRLTVTYLVGFALSAAFLVGNVAARTAVDRQPLDAMRPRVFHIAATVILGAIWFFLRHRKASNLALEAVDTVAILFVTLLLQMNSGLYEIRTVSVFNLALTTGLTAVVRAVVVPSTARRTLVLGLIASATASAVFLLSAFHPSWPVVQQAEEGWPLPYQFAAFVLWLGALVAVATVASQVIYRLRHEVHAARQLGQYVLGEKLGEGGMGIVYRATHALLRRETALKLLPPDRVDADTIRRFEREVVETARLRHPNTVAIYDYGRTPEGVFYYAMEYLDGLEIGELVRREGPLPPGRVVWLLAQVCASLEEAHSIGLVHRDIKPANVMIVGITGVYDFVRVLDFGLVKSRAPLDGGTSLTNVNLLTGTPLYMAPEAIARPDAAEPRSDLYAVAAVGYLMLTGQHVFAASSVAELLAAHLHAPPVPIRERLGAAVPPDLEALILRGLAKSPADRPPSAAAFREALLGCDVPRWTQEDARAWWRTRGERARRRDAPALELTHAPTVTVVGERALHP
jgi:serine/threonine-protein kinase